MSPESPFELAEGGHLTWQARPAKELLRLSGPMVLSLLSVSIMTLTDTLFIGHLGPVPLAAVGLGGMSAFTVISFSIAVYSGARILVGEQVGRGERALVQRSLGNFLRLALFLSLLSLLVGTATALCLEPLSASAAAGRLARDYTQVRTLGFPFVVVSQAIGQVRQAQGDSQSPMRATLAGSIVNIPLNFVLIFVLDGGVVGAAWATVAARAVEMAWLILAQRAEGLTLRGSSTREAWSALMRGLPTGLERVLDMIAFTALPVLLMIVSERHVAAHQIILQVMMLSFLPIHAVGDAVSILISQASGARRPDLIRRLSTVGLVGSLSYALFLSLNCVLLRVPIVRIFTSDNALVSIGAQTLLIAALLQLINAGYTILKGILRGLSELRYVAWVTIGCAWVVTPPLTYLLGVRAGFGAPGAWFVLCVETAIGSLLLVARLRSRSRAVQTSL